MKQLIYFFIPLLAVFAFRSDKKINIWLIGDSTMAGKKPARDPESGWGAELAPFFKDGAIVHNHAASGRSSKSFVKQNRWKSVLDSIRPGDYVIIQFGHNDEKPDSLLHTEPFTSYMQLLKKFIDETRSAGGNPIVCSSIVRRQFDDQGNLKDTHGDYITAARQIAAGTKTPFIDMEARSRKLVSDLGPEKSKSLFVYCKPGECPKRPRGVQDSTHLNHEGARQIAALFAKDAKDQQLPLAKLLK